MVDLAIVGGGPAGLALAIAAARERLSAVVLERCPGPPDKACGEGILPRGLRALEALGVRQLLDADDCAPLDGIRYVQDDAIAEACFDGPALGVRRTALERALRRRATELGVELRDHCEVRAHQRGADEVLLETDRGELRARLLVGADGLASSVRRAAHLDSAVDGARRFGVRRHFHLRPWSRFVEVHFADGVECYVTPAGRDRVGVAFLWEPRASEPARFETMLARFPTVRARLGFALPETEARGAGPLRRSARARVADRLLLIGDAAGYIDAVSGEGLSLAFGCAVAVAPLLPGALARGATADALARYETIYARHYRRYAMLTRTLLLLVRRPPLRRAAVRFLAGHPRGFHAALSWAVG